MKFCQKCGKELHDDAVICIGCGCAVPSSQSQSTTQAPNTGSQQPATNSTIYSYDTTINTMSIISIILGAVGIPLAWLLAILGYALGGTGLALAIITMKKDVFATKPKVGLILSIITLACSVINSILGMIIMLA